MWPGASQSSPPVEISPSLPPSWADNEETEGSDVPADYLLGDVEGEEEELYLLDPEHAHSEWGLGGPEVGGGARGSDLASPPLPCS